MFAQLLAANQEQYDLHSSLKYQPKPHLSEAASSVKDIKFADSVYKKYGNRGAAGGTIRGPKVPKTQLQKWRAA